MLGMDVQVAEICVQKCVLCLHVCFSYNSGFNKNSIDPYDIKIFGLSSVPNIMKGQLVIPSVFCRKYKR